VKLTADTNVLVRAAAADDPRQAALAAEALLGAEAVVLPLPVLCEFVWVLGRGYRLSAEDVALALEALLAAPNAVYDEPAVERGLAFLRLGGDFADGVIAFAGLELGAEEFVTFDREAARLAAETGLRARLLGPPPG
jgi:predicted nucleic-acid-binding protein